MSGYIKFRNESKEISAHRGDIYLCGNEYRIGDPILGTPINAETKRGRILSYLLEHLGENIPYEKLGEISGSKNPREMMVGFRHQMKSSQLFRFAGRPGNRPGGGDCVRLEEVIKAL